MTCDDCGQPAEEGRLTVQGKAWCAEHGRIRWDLGCDKTTPGWLFDAKRGPLYYLGPLPENKD